jgi:hypothetical protein
MGKYLYQFSSPTERDQVRYVKSSGGNCGKPENEIRFQFQNKPWHANPSTEEAGRAPRGSAVLQSMESPFNSLGFDLVVIRISGRQANS